MRFIGLLKGLLRHVARDVEDVEEAERVAAEAEAQLE